MKNIPYNSYNIIFESLLDSGYSESELVISPDSHIFTDYTIHCASFYCLKYFLIVF